MLSRFNQAGRSGKVVNEPQAKSLSSHHLRSSEWPADDNGWLITLSDLTLLLLCFLVLWYVQDKTSAQKAAAPIPSIKHGETSPKSALTESGIPVRDWEILRDEMVQYTAQLGLGRDVRIESEGAELVISIKDSISFPSGKADLRPKALPLIEKIAAVAVSRPDLSLGVNGHADSRPISTYLFPSNWELSAARASRVARHLVERGVHPSRIAVQGHATNQPRVPNSTARNRSLNRRVEIRLYPSAGLHAR
jgi:chemotaxis protein MotB